MRLDQLLEGVAVLGITGPSQIEVEGLTYDSRQVKPGWLFVAISGHKVDGKEYVVQALSNGAVAVASEEQLVLGSGVVHLQVPHARQALAELSRAFFGDLSRQLKVVGITGTNGKTTTAFMIRDLLKMGGRTPGLVGTVTYDIGEHSIPSSRTTPESPDLYALFQRMKEAECDAVVLEVSSHSIVLDRIYGINFEIGVFTNLTQDHLDFHTDMERYFSAKAKLFQMGDNRSSRSMVINMDDAWGRKLIQECGDDPDLLTYGFAEEAKVCASKISVSVEGTCFYVSTPWGEEHICLKLLGRFNIYNALSALSVGGLMGIPLPCMAQTLRDIAHISGRLEGIQNRKKRKIFVDYAHTDDALKNVLTTLREICKGKLIVVFGCGGDRDSGKREKMGRVAAEWADYSIITSDNPRTEEPLDIATEIVAGFSDESKYDVVLDRFTAIKKGIRRMGRKDILLIAGKGHETYQESKGTVIPFDDRETVREILG